MVLLFYKLTQTPTLKLNKNNSCYVYCKVKYSCIVSYYFYQLWLFLLFLAQRHFSKSNKCIETNGQCTVKNSYFLG